MERAWHAFIAYLVLALIMTWPLALGLGRDVPSDLGDPVFMMWTFTWGGEQLLAILSGEFSRLSTLFDANIFHPAPTTLAYSDHALAQAVQILPVWATTRNPILCFNLLYLSTFALSGLGAFLFVRELTGDRRAAFVAGLLFAFAPYRFPQSSHLQVLSSQWMAFTLYGFRRYVASASDGAGTRGGRWRPILGAAAALVMQFHSSIYHMMYFLPFVAAYVVWELLQRGLWHRARVWLQLAVASVLVVALTLPLLLPYMGVKEQLRITRSRSELVRYSADVYSYATAAPNQIVWGTVADAYPKPEGHLFPGLVTVLLAVIGIGTWRRDAAAVGPAPVTRLARLLLSLAAVHLLAAAATLLYRRLVFDVGLFTIRVTNIDQLLLRALLLTAIAAIVSPGCRNRLAAFMRTRGFLVVALLSAMWLSLGIAPQALGRPLNLTSLYELFYQYVPGFDGLRAPARLAMIAVLILAVLGGYGAAAVSRWRWSAPVFVVLATAFLAESMLRPFPINGVEPLREYATPEPRVYRPARAPAVYHRLAGESGVVLAELPFGEPDFDIRAMFYSVVHRGRLLNGYSGVFPPHYGPVTVALSDIPAHPLSAWDTLRGAGVSHVIVHEDAWLDGRGPRTTEALKQLGATELFRDGGDVLLRVR